MQALRPKFFLCFAILMFAAKPFIGFGLHNIIIVNNCPLTILVKSFSKRKQEFVDGSDFNIRDVQQRLANPVLFAFLLFSFFLNALYPFVLGRIKLLTGKILSDIQLRLIPPDHLYLLTGKLSI
ncbi:MAG: hypothetical protein JWR76_1809 [Mucilaginibacter sp.]|jgi:hypothetical protein|nr:hypothetical protein [Mucilaginibacter sp.]